MAKIFCGGGHPLRRSHPPRRVDLRAYALKLNLTPPEKSPNYGLDSGDFVMLFCPQTKLRSCELHTSR